MELDPFHRFACYNWNPITLFGKGVQCIYEGSLEWIYHTTHPRASLDVEMGYPEPLNPSPVPPAPHIRPPALQPPVQVPSVTPPPLSTGASKAYATPPRSPVQTSAPSAYVPPTPVETPPPVFTAYEPPLYVAPEICPHTPMSQVETSPAKGHIATPMSNPPASTPAPVSIHVPSPAIVPEIHAPIPIRQVTSAPAMINVAIRPNPDSFGKTEDPRKKTEMYRRHLKELELKRISDPEPNEYISPSHATPPPPYVHSPSPVRQVPTPHNEQPLHLINLPLYQSSQPEHCDYLLPPLEVLPSAALSSRCPGTRKKARFAADPYRRPPSKSSSYVNHLYEADDEDDLRSTSHSSQLTDWAAHRSRELPLMKRGNPRPSTPRPGHHMHTSTPQLDEPVARKQRRILKAQQRKLLIQARIREIQERRRGREAAQNGEGTWGTSLLAAALPRVDEGPRQQGFRNGSNGQEAAQQNDTWGTGGLAAALPQINERPQRQDASSSSSSSMALPEVGERLRRQRVQTRLPSLDAWDLASPRTPPPHPSDQAKIEFASIKDDINERQTGNSEGEKLYSRSKTPTTDQARPEEHQSAMPEAWEKSADVGSDSDQEGDEEDQPKDPTQDLVDMLNGVQLDRRPLTIKIPSLAERRRLSQRS